MNTRKEYDACLGIVQQVLRQWDPYSLLAGGAPQTEFDSEAVEVMTHVPRIHNAKDAALALSAVFSTSFEACGFSEAECHEAGAALFLGLVEAGFVRAQQ
jgi:hypothetical protein